MTNRTPAPAGGDRATDTVTDQSAIMRLTPPISWAAPTMLLFGGATLAAAYIAEYGFGLQPCILCLYQRVPFMALIALALAGLLLARGGRAARILLGIGSAVMVGSAALAAYHVGVEQGWWPGPAMCGTASINFSDLEAYRASIMNSGIVRCDEIAFSFLGISMAGYNALMSIAAAVLLALWAATASERKAQHP